MNITKEDFDYIESKKIHLEQCRLGFLQGMDEATKVRFHSIHVKYIGAMILTSWCSGCVMDMMRRVDKWYVKQLETITVVEPFTFPDDLDKIIPQQIIPVPAKKRGRKPKQ